MNPSFPTFPGQRPCEMKLFERDVTFDVGTIRPIMGFDAEPIASTGGFRLAPTTIQRWEYSIEAQAIFRIGWYRLDLLDEAGQIRGSTDASAIRWFDHVIDGVEIVSNDRARVAPEEIQCILEFTLTAPPLMIFKPQLRYRSFEDFPMPSMPAIDKAIATAKPSMTVARRKK